jgi:hypothetical protein
MNTLIQNKNDFPIYFYLVKEDKIVWDYYKLQSKDYFLVLGERNITKEDPAADCVAVAPAASTARPTGASWDEYNKIIDEARKEYEETKQIKGFECLSCDGSNIKFWISHYDMELMNK